jgi:hypothetical protein
VLLSRPASLLDAKRPICTANDCAKVLGRPRRDEDIRVLAVSV